MSRSERRTRHLNPRVQNRKWKRKDHSKVAVHYRTLAGLQADLVDMQVEEGKTSKSNGKITAKPVSKNQEDNQPERPVEKKGPSSESSKKLAHVRGTYLAHQAQLTIS